MSSTLSGGPGRRVLVVDDDPDARLSLQLLLNALGHQVTLAGDGAEALRKAHTDRPQVAVIDLKLPVVDGYEVARRVRAELGDGVLLIAYSAYSLTVWKRVCDCGFDAHFVKGSDPATLTGLLTGGRAAASRSALAVGPARCRCGKHRLGGKPEQK